MLNATESLKQIKSLLDVASVYGYTDIMKTTTDNDGVDTETIDISANEQFEADLAICAEDVYTIDLHPVIAKEFYALIKAKDFTDYDENEKLLFLAEVYLTAAMFLTKYALRYESDKFKTQLDFANKTTQIEKSGKLYTADRYQSMAFAYLSKIDNYNDFSVIDPGKKQIYIRRY